MQDEYETPNDDLLTVVTCNVRYGRANDGPNAWPLRQEALRALLAGLDPDILCLQEPYIEQVQAIGATFPDHTRVGVGRVDGREEGEWATIFARSGRLSVEKLGTFWLSETPDVAGSRGWDAAYHPRICTWARLTDALTGQPVRVYNSHWDNEGALARLNSARLIGARILEDTSAAIVTGDFNCTPLSVPVRYLLGQAAGDLPADFPPSPSLTDAYAVARPADDTAEGTYHDFRGEWNGDRIDYILVTEGIEAAECRIVRDGFGDGRYPSDHFPVVAKLRMMGAAG